jgi:hypothetical protein
MTSPISAGSSPAAIFSRKLSIVVPPPEMRTPRRMGDGAISDTKKLQQMF